jgi:hypothetical protein
MKFYAEFVKTLKGIQVSSLIGLIKARNLEAANLAVLAVPLPLDWTLERVGFSSREQDGVLIESAHNFMDGMTPVVTTNGFRYIKYGAPCRLEKTLLVWRTYLPVGETYQEIDEVKQHEIIVFFNENRKDLVTRANAVVFSTTYEIGGATQNRHLSALESLAVWKAPCETCHSSKCFNFRYNTPLGLDHVVRCLQS